MKTETPDRFFDLAMMKIAGHASPAELAELEGLLSQDPGLNEEYDRLKAESQLMTELMPMVSAIRKEKESMDEGNPLTLLLEEARRLLAEVEEGIRTVGPALAFDGGAEACVAPHPADERAYSHLGSSPALPASPAPSIEAAFVCEPEPVVPVVTSSLILEGPTGGSITVNIKTNVGKSLVDLFGEDAKFWSEPQFTLDRAGMGWQVTHDSNAQNETMLNGKAITGTQPVKNGDELAVGRESIGIIKLPLKVGIDQAVEAAQEIEDAGGKANASCEIVSALIKAGELKQAVEAAQEIGHPKMKAKALRKIALALVEAVSALVEAEAGEFRQAVEVAREIEDAEMKAIALRKIALAMIEAGEFRQAVEVAQEFGHTVLQATALRKIVSALIEAGEFRQAVEVAQEFGHPEFKASTLREIIASLETKNPPGP